MQNNVIVLGLVAVVLALIGGMAFWSLNGDTEVTQSVNGTTVTIHKSPSCGCCGEYGAYLESLGYTVAVEMEEDMALVKLEMGVPYELESCHTAEVEGYVVEGHVPEAAIAKLLQDRPDIKGIGMAGMPSGSPGMPGPKNEPFTVYEITYEGTQGAVFMTL